MCDDVTATAGYNLLHAATQQLRPDHYTVQQLALLPYLHVFYSTVTPDRMLAEQIAPYDRMVFESTICIELSIMAYSGTFTAGISFLCIVYKHVTAVMRSIVYKKHCN